MSLSTNFYSHILYVSESNQRGTALLYFEEIVVFYGHWFCG